MHSLRFAMLLLAPLVLLPSAPAGAAPAACGAKAAATIEALARHDHDGARRYLDAMLVANSQQMEAMWDALIEQNWGPYRAHDAPQSTTYGDGVTTVSLPVHFDHGDTTATFTCNPKHGGAIVEFSLL